MIDVFMPRLSDTMTEGTISSWRKQPGEQVKAGEVLVEIETDKALMEQEAYEDGTLSEIFVTEGELAPIGTLIARIDDGVPSNTAAPVAAAPRQLASPLVRKLARERGIDLAPIQGSGPGGRIVRADIESQLGTEEQSDGQQSDVQRIADNTVPMSAGSALHGSAQHGSTQHGTALNVPGPGETSLQDDSTTVPFDPIRQIIASRLTASATSIPSFTVTSSADVTEMLELRQTINLALSTRGTKLSVNDVIVRAVALALRKLPGINASFSAQGSGATVLHSNVHIGVAMASEAGLVVPVIRHADTLSVSAIAAASKQFAQHATDRTLAPGDMQGGTFTVSNLGMFGVDQFDAIIHAPQGAILAVGSAREELKLCDGVPVARQRLSVTLTSDHRIIDGALAAQFLQELTRLLESPLEVIA